MDFSYSDEQVLLRDSAATWLRKHWPEEGLNAALDDPAGPPTDRIWSQVAQMGWAEAAAEESVLLSMLLERTAYALLPGAFFSTVGLSAPFGADAEEPTTLASAEEGARLLGDRVSTGVDAQGHVTGRKILVPDAAACSRAVVTTTDGPRLVDLADASVVVRSTSDRSRPLADVEFDATPSQPLPATDLTTARARVLLAAASECVGVAQRALDLAVAYTAVREQYGRAIATYQAVSHPLAEVYVDVELSRSLVQWAAMAFDDDGDDAVSAAAAAKAKAGAAAVRSCEVAIQMHGGIGFTWESVLHRFYKRAQWLDAFEGNAQHHRAQLALALWR